MLRNQSSTNTTLMEEIPLSLLRRRITCKCVVIPWYGIVLYLHGSRRGKFFGAELFRFFFIINLSRYCISVCRCLYFSLLFKRVKMIVLFYMFIHCMFKIYIH